MLHKDFEINKLMRLHQAIMMRLWEGRRFSLLKISAQQAKVPGIKPREQECSLCLQGQACECVCERVSRFHTVPQAESSKRRHRFLPCWMALGCWFSTRGSNSPAQKPPFPRPTTKFTWSSQFTQLTATLIFISSTRFENHIPLLIFHA